MRVSVWSTGTVIVSCPVAFPKGVTTMGGSARDIAIFRARLRHIGGVVKIRRRSRSQRLRRHVAHELRNAPAVIELCGDRRSERAVHVCETAAWKLAGEDIELAGSAEARGLHIHQERAARGIVEERLCEHDRVSELDTDWVRRTRCR